MPTRKHFKKAVKRFKKRFHKKRGPTTGHMGVVVADRSIVKFKYFDNATPVRGVGAVTTFNWRYSCGNFYDPDPLVGSGDVSGRVEWGYFYNNYRVLACKISAKLCNLTAAPIIFYLAPSAIDFGTAYGAVGDFSELKYGQHTIMGPLTGMGATKTLRGSITAVKLLGDKSVADDAAYTGVMGANPTTNWGFWNLGIYSPSQNLVASSVVCDIQIEYTVELYSRKNINT